MTGVATGPYAPRAFLEGPSGLAPSTVSRKLRDIPVQDPKAEVRRYLLDHPISRKLLGEKAHLADASRWVTHAQIADATGIPLEGARLLTDMSRLDAKVVNELGAPLFERQATAGAARFAGLDPSRLLAVTPGTSLAIVGAEGHGAPSVASLLAKAPGWAKVTLGIGGVLAPLAAVDVAASNRMPSIPTAALEMVTVGGAAYGITRVASTNSALHAVGTAGKYTAGAGAAMVVASLLMNQERPS